MAGPSAVPAGNPQDGDYRASGCAACHVIYSDAGAYEGDDKAIPKGTKDRPRLHRITNNIPVSQCLHCHNRGGRTGVSYIGDMGSDGYGIDRDMDDGRQLGILGTPTVYINGKILMDHSLEGFETAIEAALKK